MLVLLFVLYLFLPITVTAHSGRTDANGGHYDGGGYHYHHGYPAHSHWDMDGDGLVDCPYNFEDRTGENSGNPSNGASTGSAVRLSYSDGYEDGYDEGYQQGKDYGYSDGHTDGYKKGKDEGYDNGYDKGYKEGSDSGYKEGYKQAEADLIKKYEEKISNARWNAVLLTVVAMIIIFWMVVGWILDKRLEKVDQEHKKEMEKLRQEKMDEHNTEVLKRIAPGAEDPIVLPDDVWLDVKCTPVLGRKTPSAPFGKYTVYISPGGMKYHSRCGCSGAKLVVHLFEIPKGLKPCARCVGYQTHISPPEWYNQIKENKIE